MTYAVNVAALGSGPAFSAYTTTAQSLSNTTWTKIPINTEEFDTNNNFDSSTNYRFTPTVAGYYQFSAELSINGSAGSNFLVGIYKNGAEFKRGNQSGVNSAGTNGVVVSALIYMNGSTDYVELYGFQGSGSTQSLNAAVGAYNLNYFQGFLARGA